ncbi:MAG: polyprenol phosphomannose-dependent alpha 1,6 mannosyltransferase MptB, partial [Acidimicrobiales bacterium]
METATRERATGWRSAVDHRASATRHRASVAWTRVDGFISRFRDPLPPPEAYLKGETSIGWRLARSGIAGFVGSAAVLWGASQPSSPFAVKEMFPPAWFFGLKAAPVIANQTPPPGQNLFLGLAAVYGGMVLLMRAWVRLSRLTREHPGIPISRFVLVMFAWVAPLLFVAPLFSKDAYSYVAQGEMMSRHISPYRYGPVVLGDGANSYTILTDSLWKNVTSPYGPVFLWLGGIIQAGVNHSELGGLVLFRAEALFGTGLFAYFVPRLAKSFGRDPSSAFVLAALNPMILLHLVGGAHNDALMLGLLVAGLAMARARHPVLGILLVSLAALVKVPAIVGVAYIGWDWLGPEVEWRQRVRPLAAAAAISVAFVAAVSQLIGLG